MNIFEAIVYGFFTGLGLFLSLTILGIGIITIREISKCNRKKYRKGQAI